MKKPLADNICKTRARHGLTQEQAASRIGIARTNYAAYEEDRATPNPETLAQIANVFGIKELSDFITNPDFTTQCLMAEDKPIRTLLQDHYEKAAIKDKLAVNIILGLVEVD